MIKVDRNHIPVPESLRKGSDPVSKGEKETDAAKTFYGNSSNDGKSFSFAAYKADDVKLALDKLFHGKCAYCESVYASTQPMDVEHWRPKGEITRLDENKKRIKVRKPGYYWLAAEWTNLLPSCIDCNRQRNQLELEFSENLKVVDSTGEASDPNIPEDTDSVHVSPQDKEKLLLMAKLGKKNLFPVKDDIYATDPEVDVDTQEKALLLNPCSDEPKEYLEYVEEAIVRPKKGILQDQKSTAENSILVYGLNRSRLVYERFERLLEIKARLYTLEQLAVIYERLDLRRKNDKKIAKIVEDVIHHETRNLRRYMLPEQPYCGMARQVIQDYFDKLK